MLGYFFIEPLLFSSAGRRSTGLVRCYCSSEQPCLSRGWSDSWLRGKWWWRRELDLSRSGQCSSEQKQVWHCRHRCWTGQRTLFQHPQTSYHSSSTMACLSADMSSSFVPSAHHRSCSVSSNVVFLQGYRWKYPENRQGLVQYHLRRFLL